MKNLKCEFCEEALTQLDEEGMEYACHVCEIDPQFFLVGMAAREWEGQKYDA